MGQLEKENLRRIRRTKLQHAILTSIHAAGVLGIGLVAPGVLVQMKRLGFLPHPRNTEVVKSSALRLKAKGLLRFENGHYSLTKAGEETLNYWQRKNYKIPKPKKWDKKWRLIIFDIPEKRKRVREEVRRIFAEAGFRRLQDSVWIYPFDCEDMVGLLKSDLGIAKDLLYMIVDQVENDLHLRKDFGLA